VCHDDRYLLQAHSEETFRDDEPGGVNRYAPHLADSQRLDTLLLVITTVMLGIYQSGGLFIRDGHGKKINPTCRRRPSRLKAVLSTREPCQTAFPYR